MPTEPHFYILIQFAWICRQWKVSFPWETRLKPRYICSSTSFPLLSQRANFSRMRCTGRLKDDDICGSWIPVLGNCSCSSWAEEIPALSSPSSCACWGWRGGQGSPGRSCGLEGTSPGVSSQAAPSPQHRCPPCRCSALLLCAGAPAGRSPEIRETRG